MIGEERASVVVSCRSSHKMTGLHCQLFSDLLNGENTYSMCMPASRSNQPKKAINSNDRNAETKFMLFGIVTCLSFKRCC